MISVFKLKLRCKSTFLLLRTKIITHRLLQTLMESRSLTQAYCILRLKYTKVRNGPALSYILASLLNKVTKAAYFPTFFRNWERCLAANTSIALLIFIYIFFQMCNAIVCNTSERRWLYKVFSRTSLQLQQRYFDICNIIIFLITEWCRVYSSGWLGEGEEESFQTSASLENNIASVPSLLQLCLYFYFGADPSTLLCVSVK